MSTTASATDINQAVRRICRMIDEHAMVFNQLDAKTGDGDMGSTLQIVARGMSADAPALAPDLGQAFGELARVVARTSGSSLSAVIMTGLMSLSKSLSGRDAMDAPTFRAALYTAVTAMQLRSRAQFGDKTILDGLREVLIATQSVSSFSEFAEGAVRGAETAIATFRDQPSRIGRARLSAANGVGIDDPGMIFLERAISAVARR